MTTIAFKSVSTTTKLPSGITYSYVHIKPSEEKPYILFCHGFPSSSYDWRHQIAFFSNLGYGIVAPDLLGYGGTDKPKELEPYKMKTMCADVVGILDAVGVEKVLGVGHDWGSFLLSRLANFFPERFVKFVFVDVGYQAPTASFDIDAINDISKKQLGYTIFGYWYFFNEEDAAELIDRNAKCASSLWYAADYKVLGENLAPEGAARRWFTEEKSAPYASWISEEEVKTHEEIFDPKKGGYLGPLNWYKVQMANLNTDDETSVVPERINIQQPTLLITCSFDYVAVPAFQEGGMRPFVKNLKVEQVDTGHWAQVEKPAEINNMLQTFFEAELVP